MSESVIHGLKPVDPPEGLSSEQREIWMSDYYIWGRKMSESGIHDLKPADPPEGLSSEQREIWMQFEAAKITCLRKNFDYGSSVFESPVLSPDLPALSAIEVRMSDKIKRLQALKTHDRAVVEESLRDTMQDLGVYAFLWLVCEGMKSTKDT